MQPVLVSVLLITASIVANALPEVISRSDSKLQEKKEPRVCAQPAISTTSGTHAPEGELCPGDRILFEDFNNLDTDLWQHENSLFGGGVSNSIFLDK